MFVVTARHHPVVFDQCLGLINKYGLLLPVTAAMYREMPYLTRLLRLNTFSEEKMAPFLEEHYKAFQIVKHGNYDRIMYYTSSGDDRQVSNVPMAMLIIIRLLMGNLYEDPLLPDSQNLIKFNFYDYEKNCHHAKRFGLSSSAPEPDEEGFIPFYEDYKELIGLNFAHPFAKHPDGWKYNLDELIWGLFYADAVPDNWTYTVYRKGVAKPPFCLNESMREKLDLYVSARFSLVKDYYDILATGVKLGKLYRPPVPESEKKGKKKRGKKNRDGTTEPSETPTSPATSTVGIDSSAAAATGATEMDSSAEIESTAVAATASTEMESTAVASTETLSAAVASTSASSRTAADTSNVTATAIGIEGTAPQSTLEEGALDEADAEAVDLTDTHTIRRSGRNRSDSFDRRERYALSMKIAEMEAATVREARQTEPLTEDIDEEGGDTADAVFNYEFMTGGTLKQQAEVTETMVLRAAMDRAADQLNVPTDQKKTTLILERDGMDKLFERAKKRVNNDNWKAGNGAVVKTISNIQQKLAQRLIAGVPEKSGSDFVKLGFQYYDEAAKDFTPMNGYLNQIYGLILSDRPGQQIGSPLSPVAVDPNSKLFGGMSEESPKRDGFEMRKPPPPSSVTRGRPPHSVNSQNRPENVARMPPKKIAPAQNSGSEDNEDEEEDEEDTETEHDSDASASEDKKKRAKRKRPDDSSTEGTISQSRKRSTRTRTTSSRQSAATATKKSPKKSKKQTPKTRKGKTPGSKSKKSKKDDNKLGDDDLDIGNIRGGRN